jgi:hypothetical protein
MSSHGNLPDQFASFTQVADGSFRPLGVVLKVKFTPDEDSRLSELVRMHGSTDWVLIASLLGTRNPRQCRERFSNYLDPGLRHDSWTPEEDAAITEKYAQYGCKWNKIGKFLHNRSDNAIRNRWQLLNRHRVREATGKPSLRASHREASAAISPPLPDVITIEKTQEVSVPDPFEVTRGLNGGWTLFGDDSHDSWSFFP